MTLCTKCGRQLRPDARFCDVCGASIAVLAKDTYHLATQRKPHDILWAVRWQGLMEEVKRSWLHGLEVRNAIIPACMVRDVNKMPVIVGGKGSLDLELGSSENVQEVRQVYSESGWGFAFRTYAITTFQKPVAIKNISVTLYPDEFKGDPPYHPFAPYELKLYGEVANITHARLRGKIKATNGTVCEFEQIMPIHSS